MIRRPPEHVVLHLVCVRPGRPAPEERFSERHRRAAALDRREWLLTLLRSLLHS